MAVKKSGARKSKRRKSKPTLEALLPALYVGGGLAVVAGACWGIYKLLPGHVRKSVQETVSSVVPTALARPGSHQEFLTAVMNAQRAHAEVMTSITDKASAQKALPQIKSTAKRAAEITNEWLAFITKNPLSSSDSQSLFLARSREGEKIQKEFPYDIGFGSNHEILSEIANASSETGDMIRASGDLTRALNGASAERMMPAFGPPNQFARPGTVQDPPGAPGSPTSPGGRPAITSAVPAAAPSGATSGPSNTPPDEPPADVAIPQTDVHTKFGKSAVAIRLAEQLSSSQSAQLSFTLMQKLGVGQFSAATAISEGATFIVVGPIDDFDQCVQNVGSLGKVLKSDDRQRLIVLWIDASKLPQPNQFPGFPPRR